MSLRSSIVLHVFELICTHNNFFVFGVETMPASNSGYATAS